MLLLDGHCLGSGLFPSHDQSSPTKQAHLSVERTGMPGRDNGHMLNEHLRVRSMPDRGTRLGSTEWALRRAWDAHKPRCWIPYSKNKNKSKITHVLQTGFLHGQLQKVPLRELNGSLGESQLELKDQRIQTYRHTPYFSSRYLLKLMTIATRGGTEL